MILIYLFLFLVSSLYSEEKTIELPFPNEPLKRYLDKIETILPKSENKEENIVKPDEVKIEADQIESSIEKKAESKSEVTKESIDDKEKALISKEEIIPTDKNKVLPSKEKNTTKEIKTDTKDKTLASEKTDPESKLPSEKKIITPVKPIETKKTTLSETKAIPETTKSKSDKIKNQGEPTKPDSAKAKQDSELPGKKIGVDSDTKNTTITDQTKTEDPNTKLPHSETSGEKRNEKKSSKDNETGMGIYDRANYHLNRSDSKRAISDYNQGTSSEGKKANLSKIEMIRILAKERKGTQAKSLVDTIEDADLKWKAYYELAIGLDNSAINKEEKEEAIALYLFITTEVPKENTLQPMTLWALSMTLFKIGDYLPALDHLSKIIQNYKDSDYIDKAIYLSGRIYEESSFMKIRDLDRARKYYKMFLKNKEQKPYKTSIYLKEVEKRLKGLE